ncbi:ankyrin repeat-containing protein [Tieghemostelium lacteum]|uniref:Ankyrin repeat-containing protein n=1 Tax=Tieghemostelium lacteum TaxID=361077 RepID=A0A152A8P0_TIELA|nr:ankyrin repeat-containing protein [Tieghemostelium lacteum]|eukprot:KYR02619.1 ankyrin repeat-containing protein [Tieghemostelium lacteum]
MSEHLVPANRAGSKRIPPPKTHHKVEDNSPPIASFGESNNIEVHNINSNGTPTSEKPHYEKPGHHFSHMQQSSIDKHSSSKGNFNINQPR